MTRRPPSDGAIRKGGIPKVFASRRPASNFEGSNARPAVQPPQPKLLRRRRLAPYQFFPAFLLSLADSGFAKRLNRRDRKESNRTHENKVTTQFIGRSDSRVQQRSFCRGCEDLSSNRACPRGHRFTDCGPKGQGPLGNQS